MKKLNVKALSIAFGITWGMAILFAGWVAPSGWCRGFVKLMSSIYIGYSPGFVGGIIGAIWGFCDGALGGAILGIIYNKIA